MYLEIKNDLLSQNELKCLFRESFLYRVENNNEVVVMNKEMPIQGVTNQFDGMVDPFLELLLPNALHRISFFHALPV